MGKGKEAWSDTPNEQAYSVGAVDGAWMMLPKRIPKPPKPDKRFRSPSHLKFVREHGCCVCGATVRIEAAHVRTGTDGGMGMKSGDYWVISLCAEHHSEQHRLGESPFEKKHGIDMKALAREFVKASPKRRELEAARDGI
jgi:hypothetical protein